jgi:hypothetical protein
MNQNERDEFIQKYKKLSADELVEIRKKLYSSALGVWDSSSYDSNGKPDQSTQSLSDRISEKIQIMNTLIYIKKNPNSPYSWYTFIFGF